MPPVSPALQVVSLSAERLEKPSFFTGLKQTFKFTPLDKHQLSIPGAQISTTLVQPRLWERTT